MTEKELQRAWKETFSAYIMLPPTTPEHLVEAARVNMEIARQAVIDAGFKPE